MAAPPSLAAALRDHARRHPHRPFLFWPEGLDWRWMPYARAVEEIERLAAVPAESDREAEARPAAVGEMLREIAGSGAGGGAEDAGVEATRTIDALLAAPPRRPARGREVLVLGPPFADVRPLIAWATVAGAALVVEPSPGALVTTAAWARPTIFRGTGEEIAALAGAAEAAERAGLAGLGRRLRRRLGAEPPPPPPFQRLHTLLVRPSFDPPAELDFWRRRGVAVVADPCAGGSG